MQRKQVPALHHVTRSAGGNRKCSTTIKICSSLLRGRVWRGFGLGSFSCFHRPSSTRRIMHIRCKVACFCSRQACHTACVILLFSCLVHTYLGGARSCDKPPVCFYINPMHVFQRSVLAQELPKKLGAVAAIHALVDTVSMQDEKIKHELATELNKTLDHSSDERLLTEVCC